MQNNGFVGIVVEEIIARKAIPFGVGIDEREILSLLGCKVGHGTASFYGIGRMTATKICKQLETYKTNRAQTAGAASIFGGKASPERAAAFKADARNGHSDNPAEEAHAFSG